MPMRIRQGVKLACLGLVLACMLLSVGKANGQAKPEPAAPKIKVGDTAPDFTLLTFDGKDLTPVSLHDFRGKKNVALAFYVFAFTDG